MEGTARQPGTRPLHVRIAMMTMMAWTCAALALAGSPERVEAVRPEAKYVTTPDDEGLRFESVTFRTRDGFTLRGWWFPAVRDSARGCVIVSETDAGNMGHLISYAQLYLDSGFHVLLYDYRGYGASQAFSTDRTALIYPEYLLDLDAAIEYVESRVPATPGARAKSRAPAPMVLVGLSMGSAVSVGVAGRRSDIAAVIVDGIYSSTEAVIAALRAEYGDETTLPNGYPEDAEPNQAVTRFSNTALLILAGEEDKVTTPAMACEVYARCSSPKKSLWIAPDAVHLRIPEVMVETYFQNIRGFLDRVLGPGGVPDAEPEGKPEGEPQR